MFDIYLMNRLFLKNINIILSLFWGVGWGGGVGRGGGSLGCVTINGRNTRPKNERFLNGLAKKGLLYLHFFTTLYTLLLLLLLFSLTHTNALHFIHIHTLLYYTILLVA